MAPQHNHRQRRPSSNAGLRLQPTLALALAAAALLGAPALAAAAASCPRRGAASLYGAPSAGFILGHAVPHTGAAATLDACRGLCAADPSCAAFQFSEELAAASAAFQAKYDLPTLSVGGVGLSNFQCALKSKLGATVSDKAYQKTFSLSTKLSPSIDCAYSNAIAGKMGAYKGGAGRHGDRMLLGGVAPRKQCADLCSLPANAQHCLAFSFNPDDGACIMHTAVGAAEPVARKGYEFRRKQICFPGEHNKKTATYTKIGKCCRPKAGFGPHRTEKVVAKDVEACQAACAQNPACYAVQAKKRNCHLQLTPTRAVPGCSSSCYAPARACAAKTTTCPEGKFFTPGADAVRDRDDATCTTCADGKFKVGTSTAQSCKSKKEWQGCTPSEIFTAGVDAEKARDDTTCTTCAKGRYKKTPWLCLAKTAACREGYFLTPGADSVKDRNDAYCTICADGKFKVGDWVDGKVCSTCTSSKQSCDDKKTEDYCLQEDVFTAGNPGVKTRDDSTCTTCANGQYKSSKTACSRKTDVCVPGDFLTLGADSVKERDDAYCSTCPAAKFAEILITSGGVSPQSCTDKKTAASCPPEAKFFTPGVDAVKDRDDATCTAAPPTTTAAPAPKDCPVVIMGQCTSASRKDVLGIYEYWRALKDLDAYPGALLSANAAAAVAGTLGKAGSPCGSGSNPRESLCACQYLCMENPACKVFEVNFDKQATCILYGKSCNVDAGTLKTNQGYFGKCRAGGRV